MAYIESATIKVPPVILEVLNFYRFPFPFPKISNVRVCIQQYPAEPGHDDDITRLDGCRAFLEEEVEKHYEKGWPPIYVITTMNETKGEILIEVHPTWVDLAKKDHDPRVTRRTRPSAFGEVAIYEDE